MEWRRLRLHCVEPAVAAAAPVVVVAREQLDVGPAVRNADAIILTRHRREIQYDDRVAITVATHVADHGVRAIGNVHPAESFPARIVAPERGLLAIHVT